MCSAPLEVCANSLGFRSSEASQGDVLHVLQAADDLHVLGAGQDRMRSLIERLQARAAQAVDRRTAGLGRQAGHQRHAAGDIESLLALLLGVAQHDVFDLMRIDAAALDHGLDDGDGQVVAADVAENSLILVRPADRRAQGTRRSRPVSCCFP